MAPKTGWPIDGNQLEELVNALGGVVWEYDWPSLCFTYVSKHAERLLGFPRESWLEPRFWHDHLHPDDAERAATDAGQATREGRDHTLEYRMIDAKGGVVWVREIATVDEALRDEGRARGILLDITAENEARERALWSENRMAELIAQSGLLAVAVDEDGKIVYANEAVERMMKAGSGDLVGVPVWQLLSERDSEWVRSLKQLPDLRGIPRELTVQAKDADGRLRTLVGQLIPASPHSKKASFIVAQDITEREELTARFAEQAEEFDAVFNLLQDLYFRVDREGVYLDYKAPTSDDLYAPPEVFLGKKMADVLPEPFGKLLQAKTISAIDNNTRATLYYDLDLNGQLTHWEARILPTGSNFASIVCRNITEDRRREDALAESESRYRVLTELSPYAIALIGADARITYANQAAADLVAAESVASLTGTHIGELLPPGEEGWEDIETLRDMIEALSHYGESRELPMIAASRRRLRSRDGRFIDIERTAAGLFVGGEPTVLVIAHDISDRILHERLLQETRDFLVSLVETLDSGVIITSETGVVQMANLPAQQLFQRSAADFVDLDVGELYTSREAMRAFRSEAGPVIKRGETHHDELLLKRADGTTFDAEVSVRTLDNTGRRMVTVRDITQRKIAERQLKQSEESFRSLVDESPLGVHLYQLDAEGRLVLTGMNASSEQMLGHPASDFVGKPLEVAFPELAGSEIDEAYNRIAREGGTYHTDLVSYEDELISGAFEVTAFSTAPGKVAVMFSEVTERRRAAERERRYSERLRALTSELASAEDRERRRLAEELHDRVSQSLAAARIRLRQAETIGVGEGAEDVSRATRLVEGAISETRAITTELFPPVLYELGISAAVHWLCDELERVHGITCERSVEDVQCGSDETRAVVFRTARELLANVAKHAQAGKVRVTLATADHAIALGVADDGVGFDPDRATSSGESGFGLFSIRERLPHVGGTIQIQSAPGAGTRVDIRVPCDVEARTHEGESATDKGSDNDD